MKKHILIGGGGYVGTYPAYRLQRPTGRWHWCSGVGSSPLE